MKRAAWLLLLLLALPATATADVASDGSRYAAWERGGVVRVLDDRGPARTVPVSERCCDGPPTGTRARGGDAPWPSGPAAGPAHPHDRHAVRRGRTR